MSIPQRRGVRPCLSLASTSARLAMSALTRLPRSKQTVILIFDPPGRTCASLDPQVSKKTCLSSPENAASRGVGDSQLGCYGSMAEGNPRNPSGTGVAYGRHSLDHLDGDGVDVDRDYPA